MFESLLPTLLSTDADDSSRPTARETDDSSQQSADVLAEAERVTKYNRQTANRLNTGAAELPVRASAIQHVYPETAESDLLDRHAATLSRTATEPVSDDRAQDVLSVAQQHAASGVSASAYAGTYMAAFETLVTEALDGLQEDTSDVEAEILAGLRASLVEMCVGLTAFADQPDAGPRSRERGTLSFAELFDAMPYPAFLIDADHTMLEYNIGQNRLLGLDDDHDEFIGGDCRETLAAATYSDGSRHNTLADKVVENPRDADQHWDVERVDTDNEYSDHYIYRDSSVSTNAAGEQTHIEFHATPIFDEDGELTAVFEVTEDRTEEVLHQQSVSALVSEITETLREIGDGNLAARAEFEDEHDVVNSELLAVTDEVNEMAADFEGLVEQVGDRTEELAASIREAISLADHIDDEITDQTESLENIADEMEDISATMEEVAATSSEVSEATETATAEVERGVEAATEAQAAMTDVGEISDELRETVAELEDNMAEIDEVVDVIADVAEQTNMLALNANIEAARAGDAGDGFTVVADEVKSLADETQEYTDEISDRIETIRAQTTQTVDEVDRSHEHVKQAEDEIRTAVAALRDIDETVDRAANSIDEVAEANDEQAAAVEEVTATISEIRDNAVEVADISGQIVDESKSQREAVENLGDSVARLTAEREPSS